MEEHSFRCLFIIVNILTIILFNDQWDSFSNLYLSYLTFVIALRVCVFGITPVADGYLYIKQGVYVSTYSQSVENLYTYVIVTWNIVPLSSYNCTFVINLLNCFIIRSRPCMSILVLSWQLYEWYQVRLGHIENPYAWFCKFFIQFSNIVCSLLIIIIDPRTPTSEVVGDNSECCI